MDVSELDSTLRDLLRAHTPPLQIRVETAENFELAGTRPAMQGKQRVDGYYFASVVPKARDVRLYFFPIYTDPDAFSLSEQLRKCLKGKSCFHIKKMDDALQREIADMIATGVSIYRRKELV